MNLVEFLFALFAVFGMASVHLMWARFIYKIENSKPAAEELRQYEAKRKSIKL